MVGIREATARDFDAAAALLRTSHLSSHDLDRIAGRSWVAVDSVGALVGFISVERGDGAVLLRSAAVADHARGQGLGARLTQHALAWAKENGYPRVYCFSTDAGDYWQRFGFTGCSVTELVSALPDASQVKYFTDAGWLPTEVAWRLDFADAPPSTPAG